ncbi:MAG: glucosaminidase domain-containing protein [Acidimicrobiales bacterium]|nr:glucosaminidase domain-containing protein [Acidimicrobiales bacterium]
MDAGRARVERARRTLATAATLVAVVSVTSVLSAGAAAGQEGDGDPGNTSTTTPESTTSTAPPTTVLLDDGDIGVVPPGADDGTGDAGGSATTETTDPSEPGSTPDGETPEVDEELPVVILPDPTPGLNAALADIDVSRARDALAAGAEKRHEAEAALDEAFAARRDAVAARRAAGDRLLATKDVLDQFVVRMVIHGDTTSLEPLFGEADLDELRDLELSDAAAAKVEDDFAAARADYRAAALAEEDATAALAGARSQHRFAHAVYLGLRTALDEAVADAREARRQHGPDILGPAVLDQEDLVAWYRTYYRADPPVGSIEEIIAAYLRVGEEEGVKGDLAFAQAILETGGFRSGHASKWNFAGIGAYDHCSPTCSFGFPSLEEGVRAHVHLLRAYADPGLSTGQLAAPPNRHVAPEGVGVRGCCQRWTQLTGVWATDPNYDRKVLGIYRLMVETARARDRTQV